MTRATTTLVVGSVIAVSAASVATATSDQAPAQDPSANEQRRWSDLNRQLEEPERSLAPRRQ